MMWCHDKNVPVVTTNRAVQRGLNPAFVWNKLGSGSWKTVELWYFAVILYNLKFLSFFFHLEFQQISYPLLSLLFLLLLYFYILFLEFFFGIICHNFLPSTLFYQHFPILIPQVSGRVLQTPVSWWWWHARLLFRFGNRNYGYQRLWNLISIQADDSSIQRSRRSTKVLTFSEAGIRLSRTSESKSLNFIVRGKSHSDRLHCQPSAIIRNLLLSVLSKRIQRAACDITPCCNRFVA